MFYRYNGHRGPIRLAYRRATRARWIAAFAVALLATLMSLPVAHVASSGYGKTGAILLLLSILILLFYPYPTPAAHRRGAAILLLQILSLGAAYLGAYTRAAGRPVAFLSPTWVEIGPLITALLIVVPLFIQRVSR